MPQTSENERIFDPAIQSEDIAFRRSELIRCDACGRENPPNRPACVYCGKALETVDLLRVKTSLRPAEEWENGWNVILLPNAHDPRPNVAVISSVVGVDPESLNSILEANCPMPLARLAVEAEAASISARLSTVGLDSRIVSDSELDASTLPIRIKALCLDTSGISVTCFNTNETPRLVPELLVTGSLISSRTESLERKRRRGKETKLLEESTVDSDEAVLDIYSRQDRRGWRIHLSGFDFSCLGEDKGLLAGENLRRLTTLLHEYTPGARVVTQYTRVARALDAVWPVQSRNDPQGLTRAGFGKVEFGSVASMSNLVQFTKYSRLQWHLL
jgi:hypothetical protein